MGKALSSTKRCAQRNFDVRERLDCRATEADTKESAGFALAMQDARIALSLRDFRHSAAHFRAGRKHTADIITSSTFHYSPEVAVACTLI